MNTPTRAERERVECDFIPASGRWFDRCQATAEWADPVAPNASAYRTLRCDRHRTLDMRTAAKRRARHGWASDRAESMVPFDAQSELNAIVAKRVTQDRDIADLNWAYAEDAVKARDYDQLVLVMKALAQHS
jgi:hypothetical protein